MPSRTAAAPPPIESIQKKHVSMRTGTSSVFRHRFNARRLRDSWSEKLRLNARIIDALERHGTPEDVVRARHLRNCLHRGEWHECPEQHETHLRRAQFCGHRLCAVDAKRKGFLARAKYRPLLEQALAGEYTAGQQLVPLMVTLTWPSERHVTDASVNAIWRDLRKLSQQRWWKRLVRGELWSIESTFSIVHGHHRHAHGLVLVPTAIYEASCARYDNVKAALPGKKERQVWWAENGPIPKPQLSHAWEKLTGAAVVQVQLVHNRRRRWGTQDGIAAALDEVLKYPIKETDYLSTRKLRPEERAALAAGAEPLDREAALVELYHALRRRRLSDVRGCIRGRLAAAMREIDAEVGDIGVRLPGDSGQQNCTVCGAEYRVRIYAYRRDICGWYMAHDRGTITDCREERIRELCGRFATANERLNAGRKPACETTSTGQPRPS